ncbi:MAG: hypothetical protein EPN84_02080 [Legionella sp.]|nr:MAG: hypothetical protein EPN84_02080 [Legionella sp.]
MSKLDNLLKEWNEKWLLIERKLPIEYSALTDKSKKTLLNQVNEFMQPAADSATEIAKVRFLRQKLGDEQFCLYAVDLIKEIPNPPPSLLFEIITFPKDPTAQQIIESKIAQLAPEIHQQYEKAISNQVTLDSLESLETLKTEAIKDESVEQIIKKWGEKFKDYGFDENTLKSALALKPPNASIETLYKNCRRLRFIAGTPGPHDGLAVLAILSDNVEWLKNASNKGHIKYGGYSNPWYKYIHSMKMAKELLRVEALTKDEVWRLAYLTALTSKDPELLDGLIERHPQVLKKEFANGYTLTHILAQQNPEMLNKSQRIKDYIKANSKILESVYSDIYTVHIDNSKVIHSSGKETWTIAQQLVMYNLDPELLLFIINQNPKILDKKTSTGWTYAHLIARSNPDLKVIKRIIALDPAILEKKNSEGKTVAQIIAKYHPNSETHQWITKQDPKLPDKLKELKQRLTLGLWDIDDFDSELIKPLIDQDPEILKIVNKYDWTIGYFLARYSKDSEFIKWVINKNPEMLEKVSKAGWTIGHSLARYGKDSELFKWVINKNPQMLEKVNEDGWTIGCLLASNSEDSELLRWVIKKNPQMLKKVTSDGSSIIDILVGNKQFKLIAEVLTSHPDLLNSMFDENSHILNTVAKNGWPIAEYLAENNPTASKLLKWIIGQSLQKVDDNGWTLRHLLKRYGKDSELLKWVIDTNPQLLEKVNNDGDTIGHQLVRSTNDSELLKWVINKNPQMLEKVNNYGDTIGHQLVRIVNDSELLKWVINKNPQLLEKVNKDGDTIGHQLARNNKDSELLKWVINKNPQLLEKVNNDGDTIGHHLARNNNDSELLKWVINKNSQLLEKVNNDGDTIGHHLARNNKDSELLKWVIDKNPQLLEKVNINGWTIAHILAKYNKDLELFKWVTNKNPQLLKKATKAGRTIGHLLALNNNNPEILSFILSRNPLLAELKTDDGETLFTLLKKNPHRNNLVTQAGPPRLILIEAGLFKENNWKIYLNALKKLSAYNLYKDSYKLASQSIVHYAKNALQVENNLECMECLEYLAKEKMPDSQQILHRYQAKKALADAIVLMKKEAPKSSFFNLGRDNHHQSILKLLTEARTLGHPAAEVDFHLGENYCKHRKDQLSIAEGMQYYFKAAVQGNEAAKTALKAACELPKDQAAHNWAMLYSSFLEISFDFEKLSDSFTDHLLESNPKFNKALFDQLVKSIQLVFQNAEPNKYGAIATSLKLKLGDSVYARSALAIAKNTASSQECKAALLQVELNLENQQLKQSLATQLQKIPQEVRERFVLKIPSLKESAMSKEPVVESSPPVAMEASPLPTPQPSAPPLDETASKKGDSQYVFFPSVPNAKLPVIPEPQEKAAPASKPGGKKLVPGQ